jgi:hypothetical protein
MPDKKIDKLSIYFYFQIRFIFLLFYIKLSTSFHKDTEQENDYFVKKAYICRYVKGYKVKIENNLVFVSNEFG